MTHKLCDLSFRMISLNENLVLFTTLDKNFKASHDP